MKNRVRNQKIRGICLFLVRLLYWYIEGWIYLAMHFTIGDAEPVVDKSDWIALIVIALAMTVLEAIMVYKRWHDETINKKVLVLKSVVIVFLPILLYYLIFYITLPVLGMLGIYLNISI